MIEAVVPVVQKVAGPLLRELAGPVLREAEEFAASHLNLVSLARTAAKTAPAEAAIVGRTVEQPTLLQLANIAGARQKLGEEAFEVFAHGTTKADVAAFVNTSGRNLSERGGNFGGKLFTALDRNVAQDFALRTAEKTRGEPGILGIAIPRRFVDALKSNRMMITRQFDDRPGMQVVFESQAMNTLRSKAFFFDMTKAVETASKPY